MRKILSLKNNVYDNSKMSLQSRKQTKILILNKCINLIVKYVFPFITLTIYIYLTTYTLYISCTNKT